MMSLSDDLKFTSLSNELLCLIIGFLPLKETLLLSTLCRKLNSVVATYLHLCKTLNLADDEIFGHMYSSINDEHLNFLLRKCTHVEVIYGLHPKQLEYRKLRKQTALTLPGIIEALHQPPRLQAVEISDLCLMENILRELPHVSIIGHFRNSDSKLLFRDNYKLKLPSCSHVMSLHLTGVTVAELTAMPKLQHLYLQCVRFTKSHPFRSFSAVNLKTFVMRHSVGPAIAIRYLPLVVALSSSIALSRLELIRVPILGGMIQRAVDDSWRNGGFTKLKVLAIADCKSILETDIGSLMIVASHHLECVALQPSLTKDSLFVSLSLAQCDFSNLKKLQLGYINEFPSKEEWSEQLLMDMNSADVSDSPSLITDQGMIIISTLFINLKSISISNCPHLKAPDTWHPDGNLSWKHLTDLTLHHCHCIKLQPFLIFLSQLLSIETLILENVFRVPSKGCSQLPFGKYNGLGTSDDTDSVDEDIQDIPDDECPQKSCHSPEQNETKSSLDSCDDIKPHLDAYHISRGTQTSDQHTRESTTCRVLKPKHKSSSEERDDDCFCGEGSSKESNLKKPGKQENKSNKCEKSTSTDDLFENGPEQVLCIVSETLISLAIISVDVSDIILDYSRKLLHLKASTCRILRNIELHYCPSLIRMQVIKCPKMSIDSLMRSVISAPAERGKIVYYEPCENLQNYDEKVIEKVIFDNPDCNHDVLLLHDFSPGTNSTVYCERLFSWIRLFCKITSSLLKYNHIPLAKRFDSYVDSYPWGNELSQMQGMFPNGQYSFLTNSPWFRELCWSDLVKESEHECFPSPESFSYEILNNLNFTFADVIGEMNESKRGIFESHIGLYVHITENL